MLSGLYCAQIFAQQNELIHETSPYLLQHAENPVHWYPWGEKALNKAKEEGKMLLISVGYSACHWCHVMEEESFEDPEVAALMNANFVCVKVDREERPDVDKLYMTAAQMTSGKAGWPLNAFALPDGRPFYGASYFEKEQWMSLLNYFILLYANERPKMEGQAASLSEGIKGYLRIPVGEESATVDVNYHTQSADHFMELADQSHGGLKGAPKFPMPVLWEYLLHMSTLEQSEAYETQVLHTLDALAFSGVYDHVGGGFFRYATDAQWKVPHFEKMLYDNAQLVTLYTHAWQKTKNPRYKAIVYQTLDFIERDMTAPQGGCYASLDADSGGEEGSFYLWSTEELEAVLGADYTLLAYHFGCVEGQQLENDAFHLRVNGDLANTAKHFGITETEANRVIERGLNGLELHRSKRPHPGRDEKQLTAWNAMMVKAYALAYRAFNETKFLEAAQRNAGFLKKNLLDDTKILRSAIDGNASILGFLDDYALLVDAWIEMYQATLDENWLFEAKHWQDVSLEKFYNSENGMFRFAESKELFAENTDVLDEVIPSSNSVSAHNLLRLGHYFHDTSYVAKAKGMWRNMQQRAGENPANYANWLRLALCLYTEPFELAIAGEKAATFRAELDQHYLPQMLLYGAKDKSKLALMEGKFVKGQTLVYVCQNRACKMPVSTVEDAVKLLQE